MNYAIFFLIPALLAMVWAVSVKLKDKSMLEALAMSLCGCCLMVNVLIMFQVLTHHLVPDGIYALRALLSTTVLPMIYMYFANKLGRKWDWSVLTIVCLLPLLLVVPNINIVLDANHLLKDPITRMSINFFRDGHIIFYMHTADLILMLQTVLVLSKLCVTIHVMWNYGLHFTSSMRKFLSWCFFTLVFIFFCSLTTAETMSQPLWLYTYVISYSLCISGIYTLIAMGFDLHPVVNEEGNQNIHIDSFVEKNHEMANRTRQLFDEDRIFLKPGLTIDEMASMLNSNRTYVSRMMQAEYGMTFKQFVNQSRIAYAQGLLLNTDKSVEAIAMECGYADSSSFRRSFKDLVGDTPAAWRKKKGM